MTRPNYLRGFTLVEMSLVLIVIGLVILIVFPAMKALRDGTQRQLTHSNLSALSRSIAAFVQANGCMPCPTPASAVGAGFGYVRGAGGAACGTCSTPEGLPPFASLGLPAATAKDGWGRWITLRIDPALAINFGVVPPTSPCLASDPAPCTLGASQKGLCRAGLPTTNRISVTTPGGAVQQAAFVLISHGPNGYGAFAPSLIAGASDDAHTAYGGPAGSCSASGGYERCNADGNLSFVDATTTTNPTDPFDDILVYMDRNALVASLGQGACQTVW